MTKTTLTALGAALIALGQALQSEDGETAAPAEATTTGRRGRAPKDPAPPAEPPPGTKTEAELRELIDPLLSAGGDWSLKVKKALAEHGAGANKLAELIAANQPAFIAAVKKLQSELDAAI